MMRLDRFLSEAGAGSRREVKAFIRDGRVRVDGVTEKNPETKIEEDLREVRLDGKPVTLMKGVVLMLHKPAGYVTSTDDPDSPTVMELLPPEYQKLVPVGRLDKETEGLLLFTDDGALCHRLTAPGSGVEKEYYAETAEPADDLDVLAFRAGVELRDGTVCRPAELRPDGNACHVVVREGKYHQVRRMLAARGKPVRYLRREREGGLLLGDLPKGKWRLLTPEEIGKLL